MTPRHLFRYLLVFLLLCSGIVDAGAQAVANAPAPTQQQIDEAAELKEIRRLAAAALYEEAIVRATIAIETTAQPNKDLYYLRGYSRRYLSQYEKAIEDLQDLGNYKLIGNWPKSDEMVSYLKGGIATRPPHKHLLQLENGTWIHIYYGEENEFTRNVIRDATQGFQAAIQFFGVQPRDVSVFLFTETEYDKFEAFQKAVLGRLLTSWIRVYANQGSIVVSQKNGLGKVFEPETPRMLEFVTHEFSHLLVIQILGRYPKDFPNWMIEGIANVGASTVLPTFADGNDRGMRYLLQQDAILPLEEVTSRQLWAIAIDRTWVKGEKGSPYAQGFHMTRYLQMRLARAGKSDFLLSVRRLKSFDLALKENLNLTPQQFYDDWFQFLEDQSAISP